MTPPAPSTTKASLPMKLTTSTGNGIDRGSIEGQFIWTFLVGDVYLDGSVMDHVASLDMVGRATYSVDLDTGATLAISFVGQYADICAALS